MGFTLPVTSSRNSTGPSSTVVVAGSEPGPLVTRLRPLAIEVPRHPPEDELEDRAARGTRQESRELAVGRPLHPAGEHVGRALHRRRSRHASASGR